MAFNFDQEILDIYNITMCPTKPRFSVGDIVYCKFKIIMKFKIICFCIFLIKTYCRLYW